MKLKLITTLFLVLTLTSFASAGIFDFLFSSTEPENVVDLSQIDNPLGQASDSQWQVTRQEGNEVNFDVYFANLKDKKTDICFVLKEEVNAVDVDLTAKQLYSSTNDLILDNKAKPITLKYESSKCDVNGVMKNGYHISLTEAQAINIDEYIKLGENSIIMEYLDLGYLNYDFDFGNTNITLYCNGERQENIYANYSEETGKIDFGATLDWLSENGKTNCSYELSSSEQLIEESYIFDPYYNATLEQEMIDNAENPDYNYSNVPESTPQEELLEYPTYFNYEEMIGGGERRHLYSFEGVCDKSYSNCSWKQDGTTATINFTTEKDIKTKSITNVSGCQTLTVAGDYQQNASFSGFTGTCIVIDGANINFDGNGYEMDTTSNVRGISVTNNADYFSINNVDIDTGINSGGLGIYADYDLLYGTINNSYIHSVNDGVYIRSRYVNVYNTRFEFTYGEAIELVTRCQSIIENITVTNSYTRFAMSIEGGAEHPHLIKDSTFTNIYGLGWLEFNNRNIGTEFRNVHVSNLYNDLIRSGGGWGGTDGITYINNCTFERNPTQGYSTGDRDFENGLDIIDFYFHIKNTTGFNPDRITAQPLDEFTWYTEYQVYVNDTTGSPVPNEEVELYRYDTESGSEQLTNTDLRSSMDNWTNSTPDWYYEAGYGTIHYDIDYVGSSIAGRIEPNPAISTIAGQAYQIENLGNYLIETTNGGYYFNVSIGNNTIANSNHRVGIFFNDTYYGRATDTENLEIYASSGTLSDWIELDTLSVKNSTKTLYDTLTTDANGYTETVWLPRITMADKTIRTFHHAWDAEIFGITSEIDILDAQSILDNIEVLEDTTYPFIDFNEPTTNSSTIADDIIYYNVTASDLYRGIKNITVYLYNTTGLYDSATTTSTNLNGNFNLLPEGTYYLNATTYDKGGYSNSTETRTITIIYPSIEIELLYPTGILQIQQNNFFNISANITCRDNNCSTINLYARRLGSNIPTSPTTPFYTNDSNPQNIDLEINESQVITFWINATGTKIDYTDLDFNAIYSNISSVNNNSDNFNVTIYGSPDITINEPSENITIYTTNTTLNITTDDTANNSIILNVDNSLAAWYRMDDYSGSTIEDYFGNYNGTIYENAVQVNGVMGKAFEFDGDNDRLGISGTWHRVQSKTISFWANPHCGTSLHQMPVATGGNYYISFYNVCGTNQFYMSDSNSTNNQKAQSWSNVIIPNEWHYYTAVWNVTGDTVEHYVYVDGIFNNTYSRTQGYGTNYGSVFYIGALGTSYDFNGTIDDVLFFNKTLSASEVSALYANKTSKELYEEINLFENGNHTIEAYAQNTFGLVTKAESRNVFVDISKIYLDLIYPSVGDNNVRAKYGWFNVSVNVSCFFGDCGDVNVSLDPAPPEYGAEESVCINDYGGAGCSDWDDLCSDGYTCSSITWDSSNIDIPSTEIVQITYKAYQTCTPTLYLRVNGVEIATETGNADCTCTPSPYPKEFDITTNVDTYWNHGGSNTVGIRFVAGCNAGAEAIVYYNSGDSKSGLIPTDPESTPYYTNESNPRNITLNEGESQIVNYWVRATGETQKNYTFFAYANKTSDMNIGNITGEWNESITTCKYHENESINWDIDCSENCTFQDEIYSQSNISFINQGFIGIYDNFHLSQNYEIFINNGCEVYVDGGYTLGL